MKTHSSLHTCLGIQSEFLVKKLSLEEFHPFPSEYLSTLSMVIAIAFTFIRHFQSFFTLLNRMGVSDRNLKSLMRNPPHVTAEIFSPSYLFLLSKDKFSSRKTFTSKTNFNFLVSFFSLFFSFVIKTATKGEKAKLSKQ